MHNFTASSELLVTAGAMVKLDSATELAPRLLELLGDPRRCAQMGAAGRQVLADNRGASQHLLALVAQQLGRA
jgi:3-deoxy-D-manno-octulosonic-acid transferase